MVSLTERRFLYHCIETDESDAGKTEGRVASRATGSFFSEDKIRLTDGTRMAEGRELNAATARRRCRWDTRRTSLSVPPVR